MIELALIIGGAWFVAWVIWKATKAPPGPPPAFVDRDDMMKWIGRTSPSNAIVLDENVVHNGELPVLKYRTRQGNGVWREGSA